ncbi:hypothetical protein QYF36_010487 [Acer negundo]|nr:hypothetical protein QYF36_010487 [Acer negundo]
MDASDIACLRVLMSITEKDGPIQILKGNLKREAVLRMSLCLVGNMFTFHFQNEEDCQRVILGGPWNFDDALLVLEKPVWKGLIESLRFNRAEFWIQIH